NSDIEGWTDDGRWIWAKSESEKRETLCGPFGLSITPAILPGWLFEKIRDSIGFHRVKPTADDLLLAYYDEQRTEKYTGMMYRNGRPMLYKNGQPEIEYSKNDVIVLRNRPAQIIWKNGAQYLGNVSSKPLLQGTRVNLSAET